jgi:hypothetical protein
VEVDKHTTLAVVINHADTGIPDRQCQVADADLHAAGPALPMRMVRIPMA